MRFQFSALNGKLLNTFLQFLLLFILFYYVYVCVWVCVFPLLFVSRIPISHFAFSVTVSMASPRLMLGCWELS